MIIIMFASRTTVSKYMGCRHLLDPWSDPSIPVCSNGRQFLNLTDATKMLAEKDITSVKNLTGCLVKFNNRLKQSL